MKTFYETIFLRIMYAALFILAEIYSMIIILTFCALFNLVIFFVIFHCWPARGLFVRDAGYESVDITIFSRVKRPHHVVAKLSLRFRSRLLSLIHDATRSQRQSRRLLVQTHISNYQHCTRKRWMRST